MDSYLYMGNSSSEEKENMIEGVSALKEGQIAMNILPHMGEWQNILVGDTYTYETEVRVKPGHKVYMRLEIPGDPPSYQAVYGLIIQEHEIYASIVQDFIHIKVKKIGREGKKPSQIMVVFFTNDE